MKDIDILQKLAYEIGIELQGRNFTEVAYWAYNGFTIAENGNVIGLNLDYLNLYEFPVQIFELNNLIKLSLLDNRLTEIPEEICKLTKLQVLILRYNRLISLPKELGELKDLTHLNLDSNNLTQIPQEIAKLRNLQLLSLCDNDLSELPQELFEMDIKVHWRRSREGIVLEGNPFVPTPEIINKGEVAVQSYLESLKGKRKPINEVKLLLVGDGGAGKTSLVKSLLKRKFNPNESQTHGINIERWEIKEDGNKVSVHIWDFGGQEIMHATHQFFLSKRSLYVLVLDGRRNENAEYWLKHIESFGGSSPILVVLNKADENPAFDVNRKFLLEKYSGIRGFFKVSCKNRQGTTKFAQQLKRELARVELTRTQWAENWFDVKTQLENLAVNFITFDIYKDLCEKQNISKRSSQDTLLDYLHDLGVILHFRDYDLEDTHVLEPKWVTEAVYKIINSKKLAGTKGVLTLSNLEEILEKRTPTDYFYPRDKYHYIIGLMKRFELCYQIDDVTVLIPDLLAIQESQFDFDYNDSLQFLFEYDFLPRSIIPRFIVRMHKDIKFGDLCWRTGVILEDKSLQSLAVVKSDQQDRKIYIYVNGQQKRDYFSVIRKTISDINKSFEKLSVRELIPVPDRNDLYIEYKELIGFEIENKSEIFIGRLRKSYSVSKLLNGIEKETDRFEKYMSKDIIELQVNPKIEVSPQINPHIEIKSDIQVESRIDIDLRVDLPTIKSDFEKLKNEVTQIDPKLEKELEKIEDNLDEVTIESRKSELNKPMNKLARFLEKLSDKNSDYHKIIKGTQNGFQLAQQVGKTYNKFAQWLALPQIPDLFLK